MYEFILCEEKGGVGLLTLNASKSLNSLSVPMIAELAQVLQGWKKKDSISCVFLQGAGDKAFCAGGDVRRLYDAMVQQQREEPGVVPAIAEEFFTTEYRLDYEVHKYPKPIVVWADGIVMGGGIGLAAGASHRVVTERSKFAMPEITIGLYPDVGGTWFLNRMPAGYGLYLGLTGSRLNGDDCLFLGLADFKLASELKDKLIAALTSANWKPSSQSNFPLVSEILTSVGATATAAKSTAQDHSEFIARFANASSVDEFRQILLSDNEPDDWIKSGIKSFQTGSPSSAHIIFEQLRREKDASLEDIFRSELNLSAQCTIHPDFAEGVRALLVDKDQSPKWQPATLEQVTKSWVESYFAPLWKVEDHPLKQLGTNEKVCQT